MRKYPFYPFLLFGTLALACGCSSDGDAPDDPGFPGVPDGMTALRLAPQTAVAGRAANTVATTANLKDFDFVLNVEGAEPLKGRYDVASGCVYSTSTGNVGTTPIIVPTGSAFTIHAAGRTVGSEFIASGGLLDYAPSATDSKDLSANGTAVVPDYIQGTSARMVAAGSTMDVPITLSHATSQVTLSCEVSGDYLVRLDRRLVWTGNVRRWAIDNGTGEISFGAADKTHTRTFLLAPDPGNANAAGTPLSAFANEYSSLLISQASGRVHLNSSDWTSPLKVWGPAYEPGNAMFFWPGAYPPISAPFISSAGAFCGGSGLVLNFQARACTKDAAGKAVEWGSDIIPPTASASSMALGDADGTSIGRYSVFLPLDLDGSKALAAGRSYNFHITFGAGPWGYGPDGEPVDFPITFTRENGDWHMPPGIDGNINGDGWSNNLMPDDDLR